jgi:Nucleotide-diphospho-sugar transferase
MQPLSDESWHIQFQSDNSDLSAINIGWYWARPTPIVREFFVRSFDWWQVRSNWWDQYLMNDVRKQMVNEGLLEWPKSIVLSTSDYRSAMLYDWIDIFTDEWKIDVMNRESVMIHYTMIFNVTKTVVAKQFGHWFDRDYYINSPLLLRPINIQGNTEETMDQIALAVHLAKISGRSFMWPNSIRHRCQGEENYRSRPPILVVEAQTVDDAVPWVEGAYLHNRRRYTDKTLRSTSIPLNNLDLQASSMRSLFDRSRSAKSDILTIDFEGFDLSNLNHGFVREALVDIGIGRCIGCRYMAEFMVYNQSFCPETIHGEPPIGNIRGR